MLQRAKESFTSFVQMESFGGIFLMLTALLALITANTPLNHYYEMLLSTPVAIQVGALEIAKPLLLWINDGLMAVFFFLIGLELKREILEGELSELRNVVLPAVGAVGGMAVPALIYLAFNAGNEIARDGWAIPAATDIAFALGILSLLGSRVPASVKIFLTSLAIFDDVGAIVIIAAFYTAAISLKSILIALLCLVALFFLNRLGVRSKSPYFLVGAILWIATLKSGVHATLAGVLLALFIPLRGGNDDENSPLHELEHDLHSVVAFFVLPVFAFANAGVTLTGLSAEQFFHGVPVGIALGLFLGKQIGIFGLCALVIKLGFARLPDRMSWMSLYGTSALCGVGFTMSLFIGSLAFEHSGVNLLFDERLGIIVGSVLSGILGFAILNASLKGKQST